MLKRYLIALLAAALVLTGAPAATLAEALEEAIVLEEPVEQREISEPDAVLEEAPIEAPEADQEEIPEQIADPAEAQTEAPLPEEETIIVVDPLPIAPESVFISDITLGAKDTARLDVSVYPDGAETLLSFASSKPKIALVSADGVVTAKSTGTAVIAVTTDNGLTATCKVTVKKAPTSIKLSAKSGKLGVGDTYALKYTLSSGSVGTVTFSSSNSAVASVDSATGLITAIAPGTATITAKTHNNRTAACKVTVVPAPTSILLSSNELSIGAGCRAAITGRVNDGSIGQVTFVSSDESVIAVTPEGQITGIAPGEAQVTASTYVEGVTASAAVTVYPTPDTLFVEPALTLGSKQTYALTPVIPEGTMASFAFKSSKPGIASVSSAGLITAKSTGTAVITVTTENGLTATCKVTVKKAPSSIKLNAKSGTLGVGDTYTLTYTLSSGSVGTVTFTSSNSAVASVDAETGLITAIAPGTATITAKTHNNRTATCKVTVLSRPTSISLSASEITVGVGLKSSVSGRVNDGAAGFVTFTSSDESVVRVTQDGQITGVAPGEAEILASTYVEGVTAAVSVRVYPTPGSLYVIPSLTMGAKETYALTPVIPEGTIASFAYKSSKKGVATVSATGLITARSTGTTVITVATDNGLTATCKVTVKKAPTSVKLNVKAGSLGVGESYQLLYTLSANSGGAVEFISSNPEVASVDSATGLVTAVSAGDAQIAVRTYNGKADACQVHVYAAPTAISIAGDAEREMNAGESMQLTALVEGGSDAPLVWISSNPDAATVSASGLVTANGSGVTTITVQTYIPGIAASVTVSVWAQPDTIWLPVGYVELKVSETYQLVPTLPDNTRSTLTYASSAPEIASISETGLITAHQYGSATVGVRAQNGVYAVLTVSVSDPIRPESLTVADFPDVMAIGETRAITWTVSPATSFQALTWRSVDTAIAEVDAAGGVTAKSPGLATIVGVSPRNSDLGVTIRFVVLSPNYALQLPARRTGTAEISENLQRIKAVRDSALAAIKATYNSGKITKTEYTRRVSAINNAFEMYAFPWMTNSTMLYWKAANSEDGAKDFKPGIVYYGMPYTQTSREYNVSKAVNGGFYTKSSSGTYYIMNTSKVSQRAYKGNDCSSFVSMAYWGINSDYSFLNTTAIARNSIYKTISWSEPLRAGDLIVKSGSHVIMFLYYADVNHTQMMLIEQGGGYYEDGVNTVGCRIRPIQDYSENGYVIKRLSSFAN